MSKFGTVLGVLCGTLGAATTAAGGVYVKDNADIVKDYVKGNEVYTSQEMTDVKSEYQSKVEEVEEKNITLESENIAFAEENGSLKIKVDGLEKDLVLASTGAVKIHEVYEDLIGGCDAISLFSGNYVLTSSTSGNAYFFEVSSFTLYNIEQPSSYYISDRGSTFVVDGVTFFRSSTGSCLGVFRIDEETKKIVMVTDGAMTGTPSVSSMNDLYFIGGSKTKNIIAYKGKAYYSNDVDLYYALVKSVNYLDDGNKCLVTFESSSFVLDFETGEFITLGKVVVSNDNYIINTIDIVNYIFDIETMKNEVVESFTGTTFISSGVLYESVTETDDEGLTSYLLKLFDIKTKTIKTLTMSGTYTVLGKDIFGCPLIQTSDNVIHVLDLTSLSIMSIEDDGSFYNVVSSCFYQDEDIALFYKSSTYGTYCLSKDTMIATKLAENIYEIYTSSEGKYVVNTSSSSRIFKIFDRDTCEFSSVVSNSDSYLLLSAGDKIVACRDSGSVAEVFSYNLITGEKEVLATYSYGSMFYSLTNARLKSFETDRFKVSSYQFCGETSNNAFAVVYDKELNVVKVVENILVGEIKECDELLLLKASSGVSYICDFVFDKFFTVNSTGLACAVTKVDELYIISFGLYITVYKPDITEELNLLKLNSSYGVSSGGIANKLEKFAENDEKLIIYSKHGVYTIDKDNNEIIDYFLIDRYVEKAKSFKYTLIEDDICYLGVLYTFDEETFTFTKTMIS